VVHTTMSKTRRSDEWIGSTTMSEHRSIEPAVMASEIERLADLEGFLKLASNPDWMRVTLAYVNYPTVDRDKRARSATSAPTAATSAPAEVKKS
jgi:hypothetical protein